MAASVDGGSRALRVAGRLCAVPHGSGVLRLERGSAVGFVEPDGPDGWRKQALLVPRDAARALGVASPERQVSAVEHRHVHRTLAAARWWVLDDGPVSKLPVEVVQVGWSARGAEVVVWRGEDRLRWAVLPPEDPLLAHPRLAFERLLEALVGEGLTPADVDLANWVWAFDADEAALWESELAQRAARAAEDDALAEELSQRWREDGRVPGARRVDWDAERWTAPAHDVSPDPLLLAGRTSWLVPEDGWRPSAQGVREQAQAERLARHVDNDAHLQRGLVLVAALGAGLVLLAVLLRWAFMG